MNRNKAKPLVNIREKLVEIIMLFTCLGTLTFYSTLLPLTTSMFPFMGRLAKNIILI